MSYLEKKVPPVLVAVLFGLVVWALAAVPPTIDLVEGLRLAIVLIISLTAVLFGVSGLIGFLRAQTTVNPHRPEGASRLVTSGVYRFTRNPMYLALALILTALAVWLETPWGLLGVVGFILYMSRYQIVPEERALTTLFGDEYLRYCARVRRWI